MKKIIYITATLLLTFVMASCSKDEVGGTATQEAAGQWYVTYDCCDADGNVIEDLKDFNGGRSLILTYNTAADDGQHLYVDDLGNLFGYKGVANLDLNALTFSTNGNVTNEASHSSDVSDEITITNGVIVKNGGKQQNGSVTDSISFYVQYSQDAYATSNGYVKYFVHGVRYSGLAEND